MSFRNKPVRLIAWLFASLSLCIFFSCEFITREAGHTYITVYNDTAWAKYDSLEITWEDTATGEKGRLFQGDPKKLSETNKLPADDYSGQRIVVMVKGFKANVLAYQEQRKFDGADPGKTTKTIVPIIPVVTVPTDTPLVVTPIRPGAPKLSGISVTPDTVLSINDSAYFAATVTLDNGTLAKHSWNYEGGPAFAPPISLTGKAASLLGAHLYTKAGKYRVALQVTTETDSTSVAHVEIRVSQDLPIANAGPDKTIFPKAMIQLHGVGQDSLGDIVKTEWKIGSGNFNIASADTAFPAPAEAQELWALFRVTDDDGQTATDSLQIYVIPENESNLTSLGVSQGRLVPQFGPGILNYTDTVAYGTETMVIRPEGSGAITVNGVAVVSGDASLPISLKVGDNTVLVGVQYGSTPVKTYALAVYRKPVSSNSGLSALTVLAGGLVQVLSPVFNPGDTLYNVSLPFGNSTASVNATLADTNASLSMNGFRVASKAASGNFNLQVGSNPVALEVTAQNGNRKTYVIQIVRAGNEAPQLAGISLSAGNINPVFSGAILDYSLSVGNAVSSTRITLLFAAENASAALSAGGGAWQPLPANTPASVDLLVGANLLRIMVTGKSGAISTYTIQVTRAGNGNADLSGLELSAGALASDFSPEAVFYTLSVPNSTDSTLVTATVGNPSSILTINKTSATSGIPAPVKLAVGGNAITVVVTAQNGDKKVYTVSVTRDKNGNAELSGLEISAGGLSPAFIRTTSIYSLAVKNEVEAISIKPQVHSATSVFSLAVDGSDIESGKRNDPIPLRVGSANIITITVHAENGATKAYTLNVTRALNGDASLAGLAVSSGVWDSAFVPADTLYAIAVGNAVNSITVIPKTTSPASRLKVNGNVVSDGSPSPAFPLVEGANTISIEVVAENLAIRNYALTVTRALNGNADLSGLSASKGTLVPAFSSGLQEYSIQVGYDDSLISMTPAAAELRATLQVNGAKVISGTVSQTRTVLVGPNPNAFIIVVTAVNSVQKVYNVSIVRLPGTNSSLKSVAVSGKALSPVSPLTYADTVPHGITGIPVTATVADPNASLAVNGVKGVSGIPSAPIPLTVGENAIPLTVTAQDGKTASQYQLRIVRLALLSRNRKLGPVIAPLDSVEILPGLPYAQSAPIYTGFHFVNWTVAQGAATFGDANASTTPVTLTLGDARIQANYDTNTYTLAVTAANGTVSRSPNLALYAHGSPVTLTVTPAGGHLFSSWSDGNASNPRTVTMTGDIVLTASCAPIPSYTLTLAVSPANSGTVTPSSVATSYPSGTPLTLSPTPAIGYHFVKWIGDLTGTSVPGSLSMTANKSVTAQFELKPYALTVADDGNGATTPSGIVAVTHGVAKSISALENTHAVFSGWTVTGPASVASAASATTTVTVTGDGALVKANFTRNQYDLTLSATPCTANPSTVKVVDGAGTPIAAPNCKKSVASCGSGTVYVYFTFTNWAVQTGSASIVSPTSASTSVTLNAGSATLSAAYTNTSKCE